MQPATIPLCLCALYFASAKAFSLAGIHSTHCLSTFRTESPSKLTQLALPRIFYDDDGMEPYNANECEPDASTSNAMASIASWTNELEQALKTETTSPSNFVKLISTPHFNTRPCDWDVRLTMGGGSSGAPIKFYAVILGPQKYHLGVALDNNIDAETLQVEILGNGNLLLAAKRSSDGLEPQGRKVPVLMSDQATS